ncbi:helix-turn-helix domain-containing protein [Streptomyces alanosinicus]|uniref:Transcriptional regulator n=1 Tax=Streptomyces alanosinicus TaxID=68171 RepID=A0A919D843_9ACTN|nr:helix-turn-helix transcriptional regulator [Streptomyces alanosinicus]GHE15770.1 transcriptional regulator [Streptomyces alanosinicus]
MVGGTTDSGFAEFLRELKNRSGHSYGTLAKRLHMGTSTLHRYCNGEAVPADYAPVERLARLCAATPEELTELHRRWLLADAGRGRKEPERKQPVREAPVPDVPVLEAPAAEAPVAEMPVGETPEETAEPRTEESSDPVPVPGGRPRRRNRTVLLAGLTVAALLGTVTLALNLSSGGAAEDGKGAAPAAGSASVRHRAPTADAPRTTDSGRSATPSASAAGTSPQASGTPSGDRAGAPHTGRTPDGDAGAGSAPLAVTTHPYAWQSPCSQHYLIDRAPADVAPPPLEQDAPAWVAVHKAVSAGEQYVTLTVQGTGSDTVVLEGMAVQTVDRRAPLAWGDYAMGYPGVGCGGGVPTHSFTVALDALRPAAVPQSGQRNFPFKVSRSDPEVFYVTADASAYDVSWYLRLSWSSGPRHGTLLIGDNGRPFRTSGDNGRPAYAFPLGGQKWEAAPGTDAH